MTKRSKKYMGNKKRIKLFSKILPIIDNYQLAQLKMKQIKMKGLLVSGERIDIEKIKEDSLQKISQLIDT